MVIRNLFLASFATLTLIGCQSFQVENIEDLEPTASISTESEPGSVQILYWNNIDGAKVADLTSASAYPEAPSAIESLTRLQSLENRADSYGAMIRGFIVPPTTGEYRFFVSGDDETQLWLSSDQSAEAATKIASVPSWSYPENYNQFSSQASGVKVLDAGEKYYFQVLFKEGVGDDHFSIAWEGPGFSRQVIDGTALYSWAEPRYSGEEDAGEAYSLGYRTGYLDGSEGLSFNASYPPLDEDQDGLYDNWEIVMGLNPADPSDADADPDNDLLIASEEFRLGTRENNPDTDGDGLPDGAEYAYGLNPLDASDSQGDLDGDGVSNIEEFTAGFDLSNPEDYPAQEPTYAAGFVGQYFTGTTFDTFVTYRPNESLDFDWAREAPMSDMPVDRFSVRWYGLFTPPHGSGERSYRFTVRTDDGVRLLVANQRVIDAWIDRSAASNVAELSQEAGVAVPVMVEYYENTGDAVAQLSITDLQTGGQLDVSAVVSAPDLSEEAALDSDSDGLPDVWELAYGTDVLANDSASIFNASGVTALEAYQSGLDPWTLEPTTTPAPGNGGTTETNGDVTVSWTAPSTRTDGSSIALSEIDYYLVEYGQSEVLLDQSVTIDSGQNSYTFESLDSGIWYFTIRVVDDNGISSSPSALMSHTVP